MKMKLIFALTIFSCGWMHSQEINCVEKQKDLASFVKEREYKKANDLLDDLMKVCPSQSEKIYLTGALVLQYNIEMVSEETKETAVNDLLKLYSQYDKYFPENKNGNDVKKAMALYENKVGKDETVYGLLDKAFTKDKSQFTSPTAIYAYFKLFSDKFADKSKAISFDQFLDKYNEVLGVVEKNKSLSVENEAEYKNLLISINSIASQYFDCENLISYSEKYFEKNKSNIDWLEGTSKSLSEKCSSAPIFGTIALKLHELKPSSKSAFYLADFNLKSRKQEEAIPYLVQSVSLATDKNEKSRTAYLAASVLNNSDKAKAKEMILTSIESDPSNGRGYLFLGNLYANSVGECAATEMEKKAIYKLASNTVLKAVSVEPRIKQSAERMSADFLKNLSNTDDIQGKTVKIGCWINETIQF